MRLFLVEGSLRDQLAPQILNLLSVVTLDGLSLFPHYGTPDPVEFVKDLGHASLSHRSVEGLLDLLDLTDSFCGDPFVLQVRTMLGCGSRPPCTITGLTSPLAEAAGEYD